LSIFKPEVKKVRNIILISLGVIVSLNILVVVLLNIPFVQQKILRVVVSELQRRTNSEISIGRIRLDLLRGVSLDNVFFADQKGDTLLYVGSLSAGTSILYVYRNNTLTIDDLLLEDFKVFLSKDSTDSPYNFQFLIDAFSSEDTTKTPSPFDLVIRNIELQNGEFRYDIFSEEETPSLFNASRIHVKNLDGRLSLGSIQPDKFAAEIYRLSAKEASGLELRNLKVQVQKDKEFIRLLGFRLDLPNSHLKLSDVWFDMQNVSSSDPLFMKNGIYHIQIDKSEIVPEDLRVFLPSLAGLSKPLKLEGILNGTIPSLGIRNLNVSYDNDITLSLPLFSMSDWNDYQKSHYAADISQLFLSQKGIDAILQVASPETTLPDMVRQLGNLQSQAKIRGKLEHLLINGDFETAPGKLSVQGNLGYIPENNNFSANADVFSNSFDLNAILDTSLHLGRTGFDLHANVSISEAEEPDIQVAGNIPFFTYQNYVYREIELDGAYRGINNMNVQLALDDENISLRLKGRSQQSENNPPEYELRGSIRNFNPHNLHLTNDFENNEIGTNIHLKIRGDKPDNMLGYARLDSVRFVMDSATTIRVDSILIIVDKTRDNENLLRVISPYLNLRVRGVYNPATIVPTAQNILHHYLPTFFLYTDIPKSATSNNFTFSATLGNIEDLSAIFRLPVTLNEKASVWGTFRDKSDEITLKATLPNFSYNKIQLKETAVFIERKGGMFVVDAHSGIESPNSVNVKLHAEIEKDTVMINLNYDNIPSDFSVLGEIKAFLTFKRRGRQNSLITTAHFLPSELMVENLRIGIEPATISMRQGNIKINRFGLVQNNQLFFEVNGIVSASEKDTLRVFFKNASIGSLLRGVDMLTVPVDGYLDGVVRFSGLLGKPHFHTKSFKVNDITYSKDTIGSLTLDSRWNEKQRGLDVRASLFRSGKDISSASGLISPIQDLIRFDVNLQLLPVEIAQPFLNGIVHNLTGYFGANLKANGRLSSPDVVGYIYLKDVSATVDYTDVTYRVSDTMRFTPATMTIKDMMIYDNRNRSATLNCSVKHKRFSDISYSGSIQMTNFLLVNNPEKIDSLFFGTFYANGDLIIRGDLKAATVSGSLRNGNNTNLRIRLPESAAQARAYSSIVYLNEEINRSNIQKNRVRRNFSTKANIAVELSETAAFGLITNSATGDELSIRGRGNINVNYDSDMEGVRLFGQYTVESGQLRIKLSQQLPSRTFTIRQGSRVNLNGDPMTSTFDITAVYRLRADLNTLDPSFGNLGLSSTRVLVDCILHIQGSLNRLNLSYEITLPEAGEDINRMVSSIINTDDLRIKEFAYLIAFNSFFPPTLSFGGNNVITSLASSSLSSVLNEALSGILGSGWVVGTDVRSSQEDFSDLEMNVSLSKQFFNERLILNTNVGYRSANAMSGSPWIGDFDLEYKLTKSGMVRAKAYNHTNNQIFRSSNTIQGVGLVYTRDGKKFKDLFRFKKKKKDPENRTNSK
jgi:hypothetical protein